MIVLRYRDTLASLWIIWSPFTYAAFNAAIPIVAPSPTAVSSPAPLTSPTGKVALAGSVPVETQAAPPPAPTPTPTFTQGGWTVTTDADGDMRFENHWNPASGTAFSDGTVFTQAIAQRFDQHIEAAYQGKQYLIQVTNPATPFDASASAMMTPVCNLSSGESTSNHLGQSCGTSNCTFEGVCAVCGSPTCPFWLHGHRATALKDLPNTCERERAWKRGAFIQEAIVAKEGLIQQWTAQNAVWIGPKCNGVLWSQASTLTSDWWTQVAQWTAVGKKQFDNCNVNADQNFSQTPVQAPCYLVAASQALNFALAEAAVCEIFARAESRWLTLDAPSLEDAAANYRNGVLAQCGGSTPNPSQLMACANPAYSNGIQNVLKAAAPRASEFAFAPAPDPVYSPPSTPLKPIVGLLQCPAGAADCKTCQGDAVACPEAGQAFLNAELGAILQTHVDMQVSSANIATAQTYYSEMPVYTPSPVPGVGPSGVPASGVPMALPSVAPSVIPWAMPTSAGSPPQAAPSSVPSSGPSVVPSVNVITFPGVRP